MSKDKDYYTEGRRDAEWGDGRHTPDDSFTERLFAGDDWAKNREDYRRGYEDGGGSNK